MAFNLTAVLRLNSTQFNAGMRSAARQMNSMKSVAGTVAKSMGMITGAAATVGMAMSSTKKAMDFEEQMSSMRALTGLTNKQMSQMSKLAIKAGQETSWSALDAAKAEEELAKAGMDTSTIMKGGLTSALNVATAGGMNLTDAATLMSNAMNAFRDDGLTAAKTANILAGAANASAADMTDLKQGLAAVGPVSAGIGMGLKDTSAALALFSNYSLSGSDAGTSFKTMLMNLQPSTKAATKVFQSLGLITKDGSNAFFDAHGNAKKLSDIAGILQSHMKNLTAAQRSQALQTMFGSDAIRAGNILFKAGADGVKKMYGEMGKVTAVEVARQKMNNAKGAIEQFKGAIETLQISALTPLLPVIKNAANGLANWVSRLSPKQITDFGKKVAATFTKVVNGAKTVYNFVTQHWGLVSNTLIGAAAAVLTFKSAMAGLMIIRTITKLVTGLRIAYGLLTGSQAALNLVMEANPIGALILALSALVGIGVVVYKNWDTIKAKMLQLWNKLGPFKGVVLSLLGPFGAVIAIGIKLYKNWDKIKAKAASVGASIKNSWSSATSRISEMASNMKSAVTKRFSSIIDAAKALPGKIGNGIASMAKKATDGIASVAHKLVEKFKSVLGIHSPSRVFTEMGGHIVQGLINGLSSGNLKQFGEYVLKDFGGGAIKGWNAIKGFFSGLLGGGGSASNKSVTSWLMAALGATKTSLSWLPGLQKLVGAESGGNPKAVNPITVLGQHATGLLQMLPSTFAAHAMKGFGNILNPVHNAIAAIRYIKSRYGSVYNTPLFRGGSYRGYNGGLDRVPYDGFIGRLHKDEMILTRGEADKYRKGQSGGNMYQFGNIIIQGGPTDRDTVRRLLDAIAKEIEMAGDAGA